MFKKKITNYLKKKFVLSDSLLFSFWQQWFWLFVNFYLLIMFNVNLMNSKSRINAILVIKVVQIV
jgi:hypothetical protein